MILKYLLKYAYNSINLYLTGENIKKHTLKFYNFAFPKNNYSSKWENLVYFLQWVYFTYSSGSASSSLGKYSIRLSWRWAKTSFLISLWLGVSMWLTPVPITSPESTFWQAEWIEEDGLPVNHISHMVVSSLVICKLISRCQLRMMHT